MDREIFAREISSKRKRLETLAQQIWENPEEPFQETIAARLVAELLEHWLRHQMLLLLIRNRHLCELKKY